MLGENDKGTVTSTITNSVATISTSESSSADNRRAGHASTVQPSQAPSATANTVTPLRTLEAALFVGRPDNAPLTSAELATQFPNLTSGEVDQLISDLNTQYTANNCPYKIISDGPGYRMTLTRDHDALRERFYGRIRAARLSPAAIEVLALVAYREPLTIDEVNRLRGLNSANVLRQLVRRQLLRLEYEKTKPRKARYFTTPRFLEIFGLKSLNDLPQTDSSARS
jgi:segregation and condensation protein B